MSTTRLGQEPALIRQARETFQLPLRAINVVRNPYDNIATIHRKHDLTVAESIQRYSRLSQQVFEISALLGADELLTVRSERLIRNPVGELARVWSFLGLSGTGAYVDGAPAFVMSAPSLTRHRVTWKPADIEAVESLIERYPHLAGYTFDSQDL